MVKPDKLLTKPVVMLEKEMASAYASEQSNWERGLQRIRVMRDIFDIKSNSITLLSTAFLAPQRIFKDEGSKSPSFLSENDDLFPKLINKLLSSGKHKAERPRHLPFPHASFPALLLPSG